MASGANDPRHTRGNDKVLHKLYTLYVEKARDILHPNADSDFLFLKVGGTTCT